MLYGFGKNELSNIEDDELAEWRKIGRSLLALDDRGLMASMVAGELIEVSYDDED